MTLLLVISIITSGCERKPRKEEIESIRKAAAEIGFSVNEETPKTVADQIAASESAKPLYRIETDQGVVEIISIDDPEDSIEPEDLPVEHDGEAELSEYRSSDPEQESGQGFEDSQGAEDDQGSGDGQTPKDGQGSEAASESGGTDPSTPEGEQESAAAPEPTPAPPAQEKEKPAKASSDPMSRVIDFASLQSKKNADIYAWISVPGTNVDYPVLQHPTDNGYYLYHNLNGSQGYPGCIYTENYNSKNWSDPVTVLYGHDMRSTGTMFHQLHKFEKQSFFDNNQYFYIYTPEKTMRYHIFSAFVNSSEHLLGSHNFSNETEFNTFFANVLATNSGTSHSRSDVAFDSNSKIVALSTCIKNQPDNRYIIFGVLVE